MSKKMTIGKKEFEVEEKELLQVDLKFYPENPRIYSVLNVANGIPEQDEIEEQLMNMEHVKQLRLSIEANGGLIDPLIVRAKDNVVLEGNSRLAAYRLLAKKDPAKWGRVKCTILPSDIPESSIFTLLGQYHIIGRKDWSPFEQAGYLYRRVNVYGSGLSVDIMAKELGLEKATAQNYYRVYSFMVEKDDLKAGHWSYYDEYLKNRGIKKYRETYANLDETIVTQIKNEEISQAIDIRNKLGVIAKVSGKTANKIMSGICEGKIDIYEGFDRIQDTGKTSNAYQILYKFRSKISEDDFEVQVKREDPKQITFELKKIKMAVDKILKEIKE
ncbi:MAG TPA: ParB/RepB/Spo0J family partition protein [Clostridia bacterium]|nr:ParB/RepB/Spo0J family partition protein [Clostridia bacterium]